MVVDVALVWHQGLWPLLVKLFFTATAYREGPLALLNKLIGPSNLLDIDYTVLYIIELMNANPDSFKTIQSPSRSCTAQIVFMNFYNVSARLQGFAFLDFYQENNPPPRQGLCNLWSSADLTVLLYCHSINNWQKEVMGYTQGCLGYVRPQQATFSKVRESSYTTSHLQYLRQTF